MIITTTGRIQYVLFPRRGQTSDNNFVIAKFKDEDSNETINIKGSLLGADVNERLILHGQWVSHPRHGKQFEFNRWERPTPKTKSQIQQFLSSKFIKGCGKKRAELIVNRLGEQTLDRLMNEGAQCLKGIRGIGIKTANVIAKSVQESFEIQEIMMELMEYGLTPNIIQKIFEELGRDCVQIITRNPYKLINMGLIGFHNAEELASKMNLSSHSSHRINAGIMHFLNEACYSHGHTYTDVDECVRGTLILLNRTSNIDKVQEIEVGQELNIMSAHDQIIWEGNNIFPAKLFNYEVNLAKELGYKVSRNGEAMPKTDVEKSIKEYQKEHGIVLAEKQREAIRQMFSNEILIVTGNPGTGKTTIVEAMIKIYKQKYPKGKIGLSATMGRAARKLADVTNMEAETVHMMLGMRKGQEPEYGIDLKLPYDIIFVDEWSLADTQLAYYLFRAVSMRTKVVLIGDSDQLPSVGAGDVLQDMIDADVPHIKLTDIFRQAAGSQIITNSIRVNEGKPIEVDNSRGDFFFIEQSNPELIAKLIERSVLRFLEKGHPLEDIFVLSPQKEGVIGVNELNKRLQGVINPPSCDKIEFVYRNQVYRQGDKIMRLQKNDYDNKVLNGDIGTVIGTCPVLDEDNKETGELGLLCDFYNHEVLLTNEDLKDFGLGYAATVHKTIGSQAPIVIVPFSMSHHRMLYRKLLYTAMSRAESIDVFIGESRALNRAIQNNVQAKRNTMLAERIKQNIQHNQYGVDGNWVKV